MPKQACGNLRIISGSLKGATINCPDTLMTRPTTGRVIENMFNILLNISGGDQRAQTLRGRRVLDLCAGSGRLGIEALSRGADFACFIENSMIALKTLKQNIKDLHLESNAKIIKQDVTKISPLLSGLSPFDIVFCDAPYHSDIAHHAIISAQKGGWIKNKTIIILERHKKEIDFQVRNVHIIQQKIYGDIKISFYIWDQDI